MASSESKSESHPPNGIIAEAQRLLARRNSCGTELDRMVHIAIFNARAPELLRVVTSDLRAIHTCQDCHLCEAHHHG